MNIVLLWVIIGILLFILGLLIKDKSNIFYIETPNSQKNNELTNKAFNDGVGHLWWVVQVSLLKMYNDHEILDFDNMQLELRNTVQEITNNPTMLKEWSESLENYLKNRDNI